MNKKLYNFKMVVLYYYKLSCWGGYLDMTIFEDPIKKSFREYFVSKSLFLLIRKDRKIRGVRQSSQRAPPGGARIVLGGPQFVVPPKWLCWKMARPTKRLQGSSGGARVREEPCQTSRTLGVALRFGYDSCIFTHVNVNLPMKLQN